MIPTITCPHCGQHHALYWERNLMGRNLKYLCNRYAKLKKMADGKIESRRTITALIVFDTKPYLKLDIPERWSKKLARRTQRERECDLPLDLNIKRKKASTRPGS